MDTRCCSPAHILLIEEDENDSTLILDVLANFLASVSTPYRTTDYDETLDAISGNALDVCFLGGPIGSRIGLGFMKDVRRSGDTILAIFLAGCSSEPPPVSV